MNNTEFLITRSVPLADDTRAAWREAGCVFRKRDRTSVWDERFHVPNIKAVINLGNTAMVFDKVPVPLFNPPELVRAVSAPLSAALTFGDLMPKADKSVPHWHKRPGMHGQGKVKHYEQNDYCTNVGGVVQVHVDGPEFRVISVGEVVVQASKKFGTAPNFTFEWVGVKGVAQNGIIPLVKDAVDKIPNGKMALIGWDIIVSDSGPIILEANTSPGVNMATAERIINQIKKVI